MYASILADLIVGFHAALVAFVALTVPVVLVGWLAGWSFVRNSWFRNLHLLVIGVVVAESLVGIDCPLTVWEHDLRVSAGLKPNEGSFIGHWLHELLFFEFEPWVFTVIYTAFGALVFFLYIAVPPRCFARRSGRSIGLDLPSSGSLDGSGSRSATSQR